jgi:hypothetical protein
MKETGILLSMISFLYALPPMYRRKEEYRSLSGCIKHSTSESKWFWEVQAINSINKLYPIILGGKRNERCNG